MPAPDDAGLGQGIQQEFRYLPGAALQRVSQVTDISLAQLVGVATFYHQFRHRPAGQHVIRVCHGTACHVKASQNIHDAIHRHLEIPNDGDTCPNNEFTVERVACLGCCTLAPVSAEMQALAARSPDQNPHRQDEPYRRALIGMYARLAATLHELTGTEALRHAVAPHQPYASARELLADLQRDRAVQYPPAQQRLHG